jgi:ABC-type transport system involved in multi-copper enzyme maturation permease subunit
MSPELASDRRPFPVLPGLGGLLRGEFTRWLGRRGLVHLVVWTAGIQGLLYWDTVSSSDPFADWRGFDLLIHLWWIATPLAAIGIAQNAIIEERHADTAPWVLSKPVSRPAFVISKIIGDAAGLVVIAVWLQAAIARVWLPRVDPGVGLAIREPDLGRYLNVVGIMSLVMVLFVAMTVFLTTVLPWRGPVAAIGLLTWILVWNAPKPFIEEYTIGGLMTGEIQGATMKPIAEYLVFEQPLEPTSSILWTAIAAVVFTVAGAVIFRREQF